MNVPSPGNYEIVAVTTTASGGKKCSFKPCDDPFADPVVAFANQRFVSAPLEVGSVAFAKFKHMESKNPRPGDTGYLGLDEWAVKGQTAPASVIGQKAYTPPPATQGGVPARDELIIRQVAVKCATDYMITMVQAGEDDKDIHERILDLAKKLHAGMLGEGWEQ